MTITKYSCSPEHYAAHCALHKQWSAAVGNPGYDKQWWIAQERLLHTSCRGGCLTNPPPLPDEPVQCKTEFCDIAANQFKSGYCDYCYARLGKADYLNRGTPLADTPPDEPC